MRIEKIVFCNYKKLQNVEVTLDGNIFIIKGSNEIGKSSFLQGLQSLVEASNNNKQPVTFGEKDGNIKGYFRTSEGNRLACKFEFSTTGPDKFTLVDENGGESLKKVTDIRNIFKYNAFTAEQFVAWGLTADGRRKQSKIVLSLLSESEQKEFERLSTEEKTLYDKRTELGKEVDKYERLIADNNVSEEDIKLIGQYDAVVEQLGDVEKSLEKAKNTKSKEYYLQEKDKYTTAINTALNIPYNTFEEKELKELETASNNVLKMYDEKANGLDKIPEEETEVFLTDKLAKGNTLKEKIIGLKAKYNPEYAALLKTAKTNHTNTEISLKETREMKDNIFAKADTGIEGLRIMDDGLYLQEGDNLLPFNDESISTSRSMFITAQIMILVNKETPILLMGRCESFDKNSLNNLAIFAEKQNCQIFMDRVIEDGELQVVGYSDKDGTTFTKASEKSIETSKEESKEETPSEEKIAEKEAESLEKDVKKNNDTPKKIDKLF